MQFRKINFFDECNNFYYEIDIEILIRLNLIYLVGYYDFADSNLTANILWVPPPLFGMALIIS